MSLILQTSGSSGEPKFHSTSQERLAAILKRDVEATEITRDDRLLTFCPLNHGLGLYAVLAQLSVGGGVILPHEFSRSELIAGLTQGPTWMVAVPPVLEAIYTAGRIDERVPALLSTVRFIRIGGAPLDPKLELDFESRYGVPVLNGYGMTEFPCVSRNTVKDRRVGSVGKVVSGIRVILSGTIYGMMPGGIWISEDGEHWHETGDIGHFDPDGFLFIDQAHKTTVRKTWKEREVQC